MIDLKPMIEQGDVVGIEKVLKTEIEKKPQDIELWLKLSLTELQFPLADPESALKYINEVYRISSKSISALILETGIKWHNYFIDDELFIRLSEAGSDDNKVMAIVYYLQSLYYRDKKDEKEEKQLLEKSITLYDGFVYPNRRLGDLLRDESMEESRKIVQKAVGNVQKIWHKEDYYDFTDIEVYIAEFITGTAISTVNYEALAESARL